MMEDGSHRNDKSSSCNPVLPAQKQQLIEKCLLTSQQRAQLELKWQEDLFLSCVIPACTTQLILSPDDFFFVWARVSW